VAEPTPKANTATLARMNVFVSIAFSFSELTCENEGVPLFGRSSLQLRRSAQRSARERDTLSA
jgi:hypothetical protein